VPRTTRARRIAAVALRVPSSAVITGLVVSVVSVSERALCGCAHAPGCTAALVGRHLGMTCHFVVDLEWNRTLDNFARCLVLGGSTAANAARQLARSPARLLVPNAAWKLGRRCRSWRRRGLPEQIIERGVDIADLGRSVAAGRAGR